MENGQKNTDREIWRERPGDYYADSIHVTEGGGIGFNIDGEVIVMKPRHWFEAARRFLEPLNTPFHTVRPK